MRRARIHALEDGERIVIEIEQWRRLCSVLDAQSMVADGHINYPVSGIALTHLVRGSHDTEEGVIDPDDLSDALQAREVDSRPFADVHLQAMLQLTRDEDDETHPHLARQLTRLHGPADETAYRQLLYVFASGASAEGVVVEIDPEPTGET